MHTLMMFEQFGEGETAFPAWFFFANKNLAHLDEEIINLVGNQSAQDELIDLVYNDQGKFRQKPCGLAAAAEIIRDFEGKLVIIKCGFAP